MRPPRFAYRDYGFFALGGTAGILVLWGVIAPRVPTEPQKPNALEEATASSSALHDRPTRSERLREPLVIPGEVSAGTANRLVRLFVEKFRSDPDAAMAEIAGLSKSNRTQALTGLLHHYPSLDEFPFLKFKLSHFSEFDFSEMEKDLRGTLLSSLLETDPSGMAAAIRGEVPSVDPKLVVDSIFIMGKGWTPRIGDLPAELAAAVIEQMLGAGDTESVDRNSTRRFESSLTLLDDAAIGDLAKRFAADPGWFEKTSGLDASLLNAVAERVPGQALAMAKTAERGSFARRELVRAMAEQGFESAQLEGMMEGVTENADLVAYSEGRLAHAIGQRAEPASITAELERLDQIAAGDGEVKTAVFRLLDQSLKQSGQLSGTLEGVLAAEGALAAESANRFVEKWAKADPVGLSEALSTQLDSPGMNDEILVPFVSQLRNDPEAVIRWSVHIQDEAARTQVIESTLENASAEEAVRLRAILQQ